jgi:hypothetical protein
MGQGPSRQLSTPRPLPKLTVRRGPMMLKRAIKLKAPSASQTPIEPRLPLTYSDLGSQSNHPENSTVVKGHRNPNLGMTADLLTPPCCIGEGFFS